MKLLESFRIRAASAIRRRAGRIGLGEKPGRLELRLDGFDAPNPLSGAALDLDGWQERIVDFVQWAGPAPVRITAKADHPLLPELVRFCHRLEMPTRVRTGSMGLDTAKAEELVDRGMAVCEVVADSVAEAEEAFRALIRARHSRVASVRVVLHLTRGSPADANEAARALGVDEVVASIPWRSADGGPGLPRTSGHCPVASTRLHVGPDGTLSACPFKAGATAERLPAASEQLSAHRAEIRRCNRVCAHPELS